MSMTKTDYEMVATSVKRWYGLMNVTYLTLFELVDELATAFESDNPKFNRNKFLTACGIE
jgi:hypothetical protein